MGSPLVPTHKVIGRQVGGASDGTSVGGDVFPELEVEVNGSAVPTPGSEAQVDACTYGADPTRQATKTSTVKPGGGQYAMGPVKKRDANKRKK